jgi:hypothetical protein
MAGATEESQTERRPALRSLDILNGNRRYLAEFNISTFAVFAFPSFSPLTIAPVPAIF